MNYSYSTVSDWRDRNGDTEMKKVNLLAAQAHISALRDELYAQATAAWNCENRDLQKEIYAKIDEVVVLSNAIGEMQDKEDARIRALNTSIDLAALYNEPIELRDE